MKTLKLKIKGMGCENAIIRINDIKHVVSSVASVETSLEKEESIIEIQNENDIPKIIDFIEDFGYYVKDYEVKEAP